MGCAYGLTKSKCPVSSYTVEIADLDYQTVIRSLNLEF